MQKKMCFWDNLDVIWQIVCDIWVLAVFVEGLFDRGEGRIDAVRKLRYRCFVIDVFCLMYELHSACLLCYSELVSFWTNFVQIVEIIYIHKVIVNRICLDVLQTLLHSKEKSQSINNEEIWIMILYLLIPAKQNLIVLINVFQEIKVIVLCFVTGI